MRTFALLKRNKLIFLPMKTRILLLSLFIAGVCAAWAQGPNDSGTYYQNADGKKGAALKTALCGVIYAREEGGDSKKSCFR